MTDTPETNALHRRQLLRALGGASTMAAAALTVPLAGTLPANAQTAPADRRRARYRESDHTAAFYRTNRY